MFRYRVEVINRFDEPEKHEFSSQKIILSSIYYFIIESKQEISQKTLKEVFCDPVLQEISFSTSETKFAKETCSLIDISYRPGVTDNPSMSAKDALSLFQIDGDVRSGVLYQVLNDTNKDTLMPFAEKILANSLIQNIQIQSLSEFKQIDRFENIEFPRVDKSSDTNLVEEINLNLNQNDFNELNEKKCLALTYDEFQTIQNYFADETVKVVRNERGLPTDGLNDIELEIFAQSWSEHCKHKIFSANIDYQEKNLKPGSTELGQGEIKSLFKEYIKNPTFEIIEKQNKNWAVSLFVDNAGIVDFDSKVNLCIKVETHNSPSALDPYGGALTGILGVNRDILGCGMGARPIANTNNFCFPPPEYNTDQYLDYLPDKMLPPKRIYQGVHKGVVDGGNKSGIPTVNGSFYFDRNYAGKPLVFVGSIGVMPKTVKDPHGKRKPSENKIPNVGDYIFMVGGSIGADGIHGATFSSLELNSNFSSSVVQIGDPLTQKRMTEFLMEARDLGLYSSLTDNGAGGLSSSVGEMATLTNGAKIEIAHCPTKYPGLLPWELMVSESQERMTVAVPAHCADEFIKLANERGTQVCNLGEFTQSGYLEVTYENKCIAYLDLEFLHEGLKPMNLKAVYDGSLQRSSWNPFTQSQSNKKADLKNILTTLLSSPNITSKQKEVRQYDQEVQASTLVKPFMGKTDQGPSDNSAIWLYPHGGEKENCCLVASGMNPRLSEYDPHQMALYSVDEAIRNLLSGGGELNQMCLLDNFCWPDPIQSERNPQGKHKLGQLVRACYGLREAITVYGTPLVSGKDSMKNDYRGLNRRGEKLEISILPTLLVTGMAKVQTKNILTSPFKSTGDLIYIIGSESTGLGYSELAEYFPHLIEASNSHVDHVNLRENLVTYLALQNSNEKDLIKSCHDVSDGGWLVALAESCFGNLMGADLELNINKHEEISSFFSEGSGRFIVSIKDKNKAQFENYFSNANFLGTVTDTSEINLKTQSNQYRFSINELLRAWEVGIYE